MVPASPVRVPSLQKITHPHHPYTTLAAPTPTSNCVVRISGLKLGPRGPMSATLTHDFQTAVCRAASDTRRGSGFTAIPAAVFDSRLTSHPTCTLSHPNCWGGCFWQAQPGRHEVHLMA